MKIQMQWAEQVQTLAFHQGAVPKSGLQDKHFKKRLWHAYAVWYELKRNLRIQIDKYLKRIARWYGERGVRGGPGKVGSTEKDKKGISKKKLRRQRQWH